MDKTSLDFSKSFLGTHGKLTTKYGVNKCLAYLDASIENGEIKEETAKRIYTYLRRMTKSFDHVMLIPMGKERNLMASLLKKHYDDITHTFSNEEFPTSMLRNFTNVYYKFSLHDDE